MNLVTKSKYKSWWKYFLIIYLWKVTVLLVWWDFQMSCACYSLLMILNEDRNMHTIRILNAFLFSLKYLKYLKTRAVLAWLMLVPLHPHILCVLVFIRKWWCCMCAWFSKALGPCMSLNNTHLPSDWTVQLIPDTSWIFRSNPSEQTCTSWLVEIPLTIGGSRILFWLQISVHSM